MTGKELDRYRVFLEEEFGSANFLEDDPFKLSSALLNETVATIFAPDFEGYDLTHGVLVLSHSIGSYRQVLPTADTESDSRDDVRMVCDGIHVFHYVGPDQKV